MNQQSDGSGTHASMEYGTKEVMMKGVCPSHDYLAIIIITDTH